MWSTATSTARWRCLSATGCLFCWCFSFSLQELEHLGWGKQFTQCRLYNKLLKRRRRRKRINKLRCHVSYSHVFFYLIVMLYSIRLSYITPSQTIIREEVCVKQPVNWASEYATWQHWVIACQRRSQKPSISETIMRSLMIASWEKPVWIGYVQTPRFVTKDSPFQRFWTMSGTVRGRFHVSTPTPNPSPSPSPSPCTNPHPNPNLHVILTNPISNSNPNRDIVIVWSLQASLGIISF